LQHEKSVESEKALFVCIGIPAASVFDNGSGAQGNQSGFECDQAA